MKKIRSVNLGGWLVLERWMDDNLFKRNDVNGNDETRFMEQATTPHLQLEQHYKTFITKDDLDWIKSKGINLVRIPFPWWIYGEGVYHRSIEKLDEITSYLQSIDLDFMLDLHTAPGCQNGFDNGGIQGQIEWHKKQSNIDKTIEILEMISKRYVKNKNFHSIELLNEPHDSIPLEIVQTFYKNAYQKVRSILNKQYIVMHDSFRINAWEDFFTSNAFERVILDTHMYQCFDDSIQHFTIEQHCEYAMKRKKQLQDIERYVPVIVGEWSLGLRPNEHLDSDSPSIQQKYVSAQLEAMNECSGHVFWSYYIKRNFSGWHFKELVERNVIDMREFVK